MLLDVRALEIRELRAAKAADPAEEQNGLISKTPERMLFISRKRVQEQQQVLAK